MRNPKLIWLVSDNNNKLFFRTRKLANDFRKKENRKLPVPVPYEVGRGSDCVRVSFEDGIKVVEEGNIYYYPRPFVKRYNDRTEWYNHKRQLHRTDGPAVEWANGTKYWYENGNIHRADGPAIEVAGDFKTKHWYQKGRFIRSCYTNTTTPYVKNKDTENEEEMELELCCAECAKFYYNLSEEEFKAALDNAT